MATNGASLKPAQRRALLAAPVGSTFEPYERLFGAYDSGTVFAYDEFEAADLATMLKRDGKARSTEQVLTLPLRSAPWEIEPDEGDTGECELVRKTLGAKMATIIDQMTTAVTFRRAFFETSWKLDSGQVVIDEVLWRPPTGCEPGFDPATGAPRGFRQRVVPVAGWLTPATLGDARMPGYAVIKPQRSFIYTHGAYRDPIKGVSDLDVAYWCWETKQKILFLLFQFLEGQSLPRVVVYGDDQTEAEARADALAELKAAGVLGLPRPSDPQAKAFDLLESAGQGAQQFMQAVAYLDTMMVSSVLAGFTELAAASTTGSYALSADQSEFFLASRQAVADEMADAIRQGLFRPLVVANFGPDAKIPKITIGPLSNRVTERALALLTSVVASPQLTIPIEVVDLLVQQVAAYLGLDEQKVIEAVATEVKRREEQDELKLAQQKALLANQAMQTADGQTLTGAAAVTAGTGKPKAKDKAGKPQRPPTQSAPKKPEEVKLSAAVDVADALVRAAHAGEDPAILLARLSDDDKEAVQETGGMVALVPDADSAARLALDAPGAEPPDQLHLTLAFLGDDVSNMSENVREELPDVVRAAIREAGIDGSIQARVFAHATFNADGGPDGDRDPCAVYGIGDSQEIGPLRQAVVHLIPDTTGLHLPAQHEPFVPHITAGYGLTAADLSYLGPVRFDRIAIALGDTWTYITL